MEVDEPWSDVLTLGIEDAERRIRRDPGVDGGDAAAFDRDVEAPLVPAARIDDLASLDQQVEAHQAASIAARIQSSASRRTKP